MATVDMGLLESPLLSFAQDGDEAFSDYRHAVPVHTLLLRTSAASDSKLPFPRLP
ncbi:hypothetical protein E1B28_009330 [Marasmius oreades]|uniref:Uncharacterized protein n=1 Tax=Marasmius oreades TaxID=181124 RepID=A0A9P7S1I4_9AGAR|nr:uncharacterized protein E1B28_009330 [Marasmius oreades]KAG7093036.1 hypothetical protein E1B28_009330 [Marasmius oreades]